MHASEPSMHAHVPAAKTASKATDSDIALPMLQTQHPAVNSVGGSVCKFEDLGLLFEDFERSASSAV